MEKKEIRQKEREVPEEKEVLEENQERFLFLISKIEKGQSITARIGVGGAGGIENGQLGNEGTETTFLNYSSQLGTVPENGVINIITGEIYALFGKNGGKGGAGAGKTNLGRKY